MKNDGEKVIYSEELLDIESLCGEWRQLPVTEQDLTLKPWERYVLVDEQSEIHFQLKFPQGSFSNDQLEQNREEFQARQYQAETNLIVEFGLATGLIKKVVVC